MIKFSNSPTTLGVENSKANITYIFPKVIQGFTLKEHYKGHCHVIMLGEGGLEWYLGNFSSSKNANAFIESIWHRINTDDGSIIDLDEMRRNNSYGQN